MEDYCEVESFGVAGLFWKKKVFFKKCGVAASNVHFQLMNEWTV